MEFAPGSFGYDLDFLRRHDSVIVLQDGDSRITLVSQAGIGKLLGLESGEWANPPGPGLAGGG